MPRMSLSTPILSKMWSKRCNVTVSSTSTGYTHSRTSSGVVPKRTSNPFLDTSSTSKSRGLLIWFYSISLLTFGITFLLLNSLVPIDVILRSLTSSIIALNTLVIVCACALFLVLSAVIYIFRILNIKKHLQDIPKPYMPITEKDIGKREAEYIAQQIARTKEIRKLAGPQGPVDHAGLHCDQSSSDIPLPDKLIYENVVCAIGEDIKYRHALRLTSTFQVKVEPNQTLRDIISTAVQKTSLSARDSDLLAEFLLHYEKLRFSGRPITKTDFLTFLRLWDHTRTILKRQL
ncbi:hypothetical protein KL914_003988 [Ogataea haglerorum]|nr:hypothetical protein KL914_003988 [Ogataea haglerorum]